MSRLKLQISNIRDQIPNIKYQTSEVGVPVIEIIKNLVLIRI